MTVPLDRLYYYILNIANKTYGDNVIIYRFWPHGSKNLNNLATLFDCNWQEINLFPLIYCNDQEPLQYEFYKHAVSDWFHQGAENHSWISLLKSINCAVTPQNLNSHPNVFEKSILLHSEKRSLDVKKYQDNDQLIPVYYWSHAVIARDWFRYAEHVTQKKHIKKTFLIYNRAWSGTREYRLRFAELLIHLNLQEHCKTSVNPIEPELGVHYGQHSFKNPNWQPQTVLENFFPPSTAPGHYSADFDMEDYAATDIEVVLETLFDDSRLHLTEKSLRPIACAQPFILAGTHGSLEYLRSYGFKTFGNVWDESYDLVEDPAERLTQIAELMKYISNWSPKQRERNMAEAQAIADYNKQHFFSKEFFDLVTNELTENLKTAVAELKQCNNYKLWLDQWTRLMSYPEITEFLKNNQDQKLPTIKTVNQAILTAQNHLAEVVNKNKK
jgi:hypothetical protein